MDYRQVCQAMSNSEEIQQTKQNEIDMVQEQPTIILIPRVLSEQARYVFHSVKHLKAKIYILVKYKTKHWGSFGCKGKFR